jgi:uncharacterized protein involved in exopolysaccharide biosynthesis
MRAEDKAALDKEVAQRIDALEAENAENRVEIARLRAQIAQMERDQPTLDALARTVHAQKAAHRAEVERMKEPKNDGR